MPPHFRADGGDVAVVRGFPSAAGSGSLSFGKRVSNLFRHPSFSLPKKSQLAISKEQPLARDPEQQHEAPSKERNRRSYSQEHQHVAPSKERNRRSYSQGHQQDVTSKEKNQRSFFRAGRQTRSAEIGVVKPAANHRIGKDGDGEEHPRRALEFVPDEPGSSHQIASDHGRHSRTTSLSFPKQHFEKRIDEIECKVKALKDCKRIVKQLSNGNLVERGVAAAEVRKAAKDNVPARVTFSILGAIGPLVKLLDVEDPTLQCTALYALLNLAIGNDHNKGAIVFDGAIPKMAELIQGTNILVQEAAVAAFLSLSALDQNKPIIGKSGVVPTLVMMLEMGRPQGKKDALRALYNLSICKENVEILVVAGIAEPLLDMMDEPDTVEKALALIGNLSVSEIGRKAMLEVQFTLPVLVEILRWTDAPKCQEKAVYVLMLIGHHSRQHRQEMERIGAVSALLEVALLGTTLAQKRASRLLENLREDRFTGRAVSAPMTSRSVEKLETFQDRNEEITEELQAVNTLVQESLERNLQKIIRRANLPPREFNKSRRLKSLTTSSSSKSLPY